MTAKNPKTKKPDGPVVYCGPSIPGVAKQYTTYINGIPYSLSQLAERVPAIHGLLVPLNQLPETMKRIDGRYGHAYRLYRMVQAKL